MSETICNLCGLSCALPSGPIDNVVMVDHGLIDCEVLGSYSSTPGNGDGALDDCDGYTFSLCEFCLDWLFIQFKIPPKVEYVPLGNCDIEGNTKVYPREPGEWRPAAQRVKQDDWRTTKESFWNEYFKRNMARKCSGSGG